MIRNRFLAHQPIFSLQSSTFLTLKDTPSPGAPRGHQRPAFSHHPAFPLRPPPTPRQPVARGHPPQRNCRPPALPQGALRHHSGRPDGPPGPAPDLNLPGPCTRNHKPFTKGCSLSQDRTCLLGGEWDHRSLPSGERKRDRRAGGAGKQSVCAGSQSEAADSAGDGGGDGVREEAPVGPELQDVQRGEDAEPREPDVPGAVQGGAGRRAPEGEGRRAVVLVAVASSCCCCGLRTSVSGKRWVWLWVR
jgi:hypothetical protein